ncbi:MAG TPA: hypothetical protein VFC63_03170 [Blastocatellia bacterium]|nr:hypothetical protein [Blastocatellia bacterium]
MLKRLFNLIFGLLLVCSASGVSFGQSEDTLRQFFEGKKVVAKIDMPGTSDGIDLYPYGSQDIKYDEYAKNLKQYGTAIHTGDSVIITKIKLKGKLIEFQLGGGGYGTAGDDTNPNVYIAPVPKSDREKDLEKRYDKATDPDERRRIKRELDDLKDRRQREDSRNQALAAEATERKREAIRQKRLEGGSRFNLRFDRNVPLEFLRPESVVQALTKYLDFTDEGFGSLATTTHQSYPDSTSSAPSNGIRKGMSIQDVEALYGQPFSRKERVEGTLRVVTCTYSQNQDQIIEAEFVEGVLIRYRITSK